MTEWTNGTPRNFTALYTTGEHSELFTFENEAQHGRWQAASDHIKVSAANINQWRQANNPSDAQFRPRAMAHLTVVDQFRAAWGHEYLPMDILGLSRMFMKNLDWRIPSHSPVICTCSSKASSLECPTTPFSGDGPACCGTRPHLAVVF